MAIGILKLLVYPFNTEDHITADILREIAEEMDGGKHFGRRGDKYFWNIEEV